MPGYGGTQRLRRAMGLAPAIAMLLTGRTIDADRAWHLGLLSAPPETAADLPALAGSLAAELSRLSRPNLGLILESARSSGKGRRRARCPKRPNHPNYFHRSSSAAASDEAGLIRWV